MSRLLARLENELKSESPLLQAQALAAKSSYLARIGQFDAAAKLISLLRVHFGDGRSGHVSSLIMIAEALLLHYRDLSPAALDRVMRAQALGLAMKDRRVAALSSAWKAYLEFELSRFESMGKSLRLALDNAEENSHDVLSRVSIVLNNGFLFGGDRRSAQKWFMRGHEHALQDGDQAAIEALLYNRAAFGIARLRVQACFGELEKDDVSLARTEISSAKNLQELILISALTSFVHLCDVRLMIIEERHEAAVDKLRALRDAATSSQYNFVATFINVEIAYCLMRLGRIDDALASYHVVEWSAFDRLDVDDKLVVAWMHQQLCKEDARFGSYEDARSRFGSQALELERVTGELLQVLEPYALPH